ncbi:OB-fold domain-containing protein [Streptosporangium sp. NPDC002544]|uniref:Zn-ribbon domain-containing OB-fold protein n=1 Tax=Streptosporangium sp. NPDC002544 TaxID=3154538 RepID=UPI0033314F36
MNRLPLVDYLVLGEEPHLVANECTNCEARYFDRRNACAACGLQEFKPVDIARTGIVRSFTIVSFAAEGVKVPFVAAVVDCDGTSVRGNIINTPPDPEHIALGMAVRLTTVPVGTDASGVEAVGYGFEPVS